MATVTQMPLVLPRPMDSYGLKLVPRVLNIRHTSDSGVQADAVVVSVCGLMLRL